MTITIILLAIAAACTAYGYMIMSLRTGVTFYRVWYALAALFACIALMKATGLLEALLANMSLPIRIAIAGIIMACMLFFVISLMMIFSCFGSQGKQDLDIIIVLGAQVRPTGPSSALKSRLDSAARYLRSNPCTHAIVSGGQGWNEPTSEALCMANYLVNCGIDPNRISLEDKSTSTVENLRYSKTLCNPAVDSVGIVTNNFHVFRSTCIAKKQGYRNVCGISAYSNPKYLPNNILRESMGIAKDLLAGNMRI